MNHYARTIEETWRRVRPGEIEQMADAEAFLPRLGEEIEEQIAERWPELAGPDPDQETHLEKRQRLNWARQQAASQVMEERLEELFGPTAEQESWETAEELEENGLDGLTGELGTGLRT